MKKENIYNIVLGGSILFWSLYGVISGKSIATDPLIHLGVFALNLFVGTLIIIRKPTRLMGSNLSLLISLPSFIIGPVFFYFASPMTQWSWIARGFFISGLLLTVIAFIFLGRNFAIFPALRGISRGGPYRLVRYPAYLGELLIVIGCMISNPSLIIGLLFILLVPFLMMRILEEEKILGNSMDYQVFKRKTRWRLVPFLW